MNPKISYNPDHIHAWVNLPDLPKLVDLFKKHLEIKDARRAPRPIYKSAGIGNAALAVWGACIYGPPDVPYMKLMRFQSSLIQGVEIMERATL